MSRPKRTSIESLRRHTESMTPGTLGGRIGEARPIFTGEGGGFFEDFSEDSESSEDLSNPPTKFYQDRHIVTIPGDQIIQLSYIPIENSEHVYWGRLYLDQSYWSRSKGIIFASDRGFQIGDVINIEYAYQEETIPTLPMPNLVVRGGTDKTSKVVGTLALPAGTQIGDLIVCGAWKQNFTDPRLMTISGGEDDAVYIGYATDLSDLTHGASASGGTLTCATFAPPDAIETYTNTGSGLFVSPPPVTAGGVILVSNFTATSIGGSGSIGDPPGYTTVTVATILVAGIRIDYWNSLSPPSESPDAPYSISNANGWRSVAIVPLALDEE